MAATMKAEEARTLTSFLKGAFPAMTDEQIKVYESSLMNEDATLASKAILDGIREWKFPPRWAEIVERIRMFRRQAGTPEPEETEEEAERFAKPTPLWVKRWVVARYVVTPPDLRVFPEQEGIPMGYEPPQGWMPEDAHVESAKKLSAQDVRRAISAHMGRLGGDE